MTDTKYRKKLLTALLAAVLMAAMLCGCAGDSGDGEASASSLDGEADAGNRDKAEETDQNMELAGSEIGREFTERDRDSSYTESEAVQIELEGNSISADGRGVSVSGNTVTISEEGTYVVSGHLNDGQILVDASDSAKIQIVLKNAEIYCGTSAAIYIREADKVFLTLAEGSKNVLGGGAEYTDTDENTVDGVIFSKADLTLNGAGSLEINAEYKHGIVSKDDLVITGGSITVNAVSQCLSGKDSVKIADGVFVLNSEGKGIKAENTDDSTLGNIYIAGGKFTIRTEDDSLHASGSIVIDGGDLIVESGDDACHADADVVINEGTVLVNSCYEGLEGYRVVINGGTVDITASDDAINAAAPKNASDTGNQDRTSRQEGEMQPGGEALQNSDMPDEKESLDGEPQNGELSQNGKLLQAEELPDGELPQAGGMPEGELSEDGEMPAAGGRRGGQMPGGGDTGRGSIENDSNAYIKITGGELTVTAGGDGLDSNGSLFLSGGTVCINGTASQGDSALDYNGIAEVTGGVLMASGSSGMAQGFSSSSSQCSILRALDESQEAGSTVTLSDSAGKTFLSWSPAVQYSCVVLTSPELKLGETYTLSAGSENLEITLDSIAVSNKTGGMIQNMP